MKHVWTFYVVLLLVLASARMAQKIVTETGGFGSRYGPLILAVILATGVLGYVLQRPIAHRFLWMGVFWILAVASAGLVVLAAAQLLEGSYRLGALILGVLLVLAPGQWQLFRYAHRSDSVWSAGVATIAPDRDGIRRRV